LKSDQTPFGSAIPQTMLNIAPGATTATQAQHADFAQMHRMLAGRQKWPLEAEAAVCQLSAGVADSIHFEFTHSEQRRAQFLQTSGSVQPPLRIALIDAHLGRCLRWLRAVSNGTDTPLGALTLVNDVNQPVARVYALEPPPLSGRTVQIHAFEPLADAFSSSAVAEAFARHSDVVIHVLGSSDVAVQMQAVEYWNNMAVAHPWWCRTLRIMGSKDMEGTQRLIESLEWPVGMTIGTITENLANPSAAWGRVVRVLRDHLEKTVAFEHTRPSFVDDGHQSADSLMGGLAEAQTSAATTRFEPTKASGSRPPALAAFDDSGAIFDDDADSRSHESTYQDTKRDSGFAHTARATEIGDLDSEYSAYLPKPDAFDDLMPETDSSKYPATRPNSLPQPLSSAFGATGSSAFGGLFSQSAASPLGGANGSAPRVQAATLLPMLIALMQVHGALNCAVVDIASGRVLATAGEATAEEGDPTAHGVVHAQMLRTILRTMRETGATPPLSDTIITTRRLFQILHVIPERPNWFVYMALDRKVANLELAQQDLSEQDEAFSKVEI
jgi:hypothetical protein